MLHLRYREPTTIPLEAECLTPENLAGKTLAEIAALPVQHGNAPAPLGDFFEISGDASDEQVTLEGDCRNVKLLGSGMTRGCLTIQGDVGMHLGAEMRGGEIHVHGHASDWLGAEMRGGRIHVRGNAGHLIGAAYRGAPSGMRGGVILIEGNSGHEIGANLRRGLIAIGGDCGDFAGAGMIAGSILVFGQPGKRLGAGMKRGTIAVWKPPTLLNTFRYACEYQPAFMGVYLRQLKAWGFPFEDNAGSWQRYSGDLVSLGMGEVLVRR